MINLIAKLPSPNKFNERVINDSRNTIDIVKQMDIVCRNAVNMLPKFLVYNGYDFIEDEYAINHRKLKIPIVGDTRISQVKFKFTIRYEEEMEDIEIPINLPKLIDGQFMISGNRYSPRFQNVDSVFYTSDDKIVFKSMYTPVYFMSGQSVLKNVDKNISTKLFEIKMLGKKINIWSYFLAKFGFNDTIEYLKLSDKIRIVEDGDVPDSDEYLIKISKQVSFIVDNTLLKDELLMSLIYFIKSVSERITVDKLHTIPYWRRVLGKNFTPNANSFEPRGISAVSALERTLDENVKNNVSLFNDFDHGIFDFLNWIFTNFDEIIKSDNMNIENRRMRMEEYLAYPFVKAMSEQCFRIVNTNKLSFERIKRTMKINKEVIMRDVIRNEIINYDNINNDCTLFNSTLKFSSRGVNSIADGENKTISAKYRDLHPSHVGKLVLNQVSSGDPGMSGMLCPISNDWIFN